MATPAKLGSVWIARATLYNSAGRKIGTCTDTPNAIAKAFMEHRNATSVRKCLEGGTEDRSDYTRRMGLFNACPSGWAN